jgi:hypothetical protein
MSQTDHTTPSAEQLRQDADVMRKLAFECEPPPLLRDAHLHAAVALDAEAARLEREAAQAPNRSESPNSLPTLAELDAAVEAARLELHARQGDLGANYNNTIVLEELIQRLNTAEAALITAAEARGAARMGGWCVWRYDEDGHLLDCDGDGVRNLVRGDYCSACGGRVRVEEA